MNDFMLRSLLRRGTNTWQSGDYETTIDLGLASEELAEASIRCAVHDTGHGSDHRTIETVFDTSVPAPKQEERLLFKNTPWKEINGGIVDTLSRRLLGNTVQQKTDRLMSAVVDAVPAFTPRAKPSPYAKRWWTHDLIQLQHVYTYWRNRARAARRAGQNAKDLENTAKAAAKQYHDAVRQRKNTHWKAPGEDGPPAIVWKQVWPSVKHEVLTMFQASWEEGVIPDQWRHARIIPLKKPGKDDYTVAKAWRLISLLATLGKVLESVVAGRISYAVETHGLFPTNHFGARKQRSAEQALVLLQEHIFSAWRSRHAVSLISFDVKGSYNGVCKERLLQRMKAKGTPEGLLRWMDAFCSGRTATIVINDQSSQSQLLLQAGLPQGLPLSPILFLFSNADLVQTQVDKNDGAIALSMTTPRGCWDRQPRATGEGYKR
jgi:hypothetical protein